MHVHLLFFHPAQNCIQSTWERMNWRLDYWNEVTTSVDSERTTNKYVNNWNNYCVTSTSTSYQLNLLLERALRNQNSNITHTHTLLRAPTVPHQPNCESTFCDISSLATHSFAFCMNACGPWTLNNHFNCMHFEWMIHLIKIDSKHKMSQIKIYFRFNLIEFGSCVCVNVKLVWVCVCSAVTN